MRTLMHIRIQSYLSTQFAESCQFVKPQYFCRGKLLRYLVKQCDVVVTIRLESVMLNSDRDRHRCAIELVHWSYTSSQNDPSRIFRYRYRHREKMYEMGQNNYC